MLEHFTSTVLVSYFAFYFLATAVGCYALQALSDKSDAAPSWMAWVPILQIHPFVRVFGTSYPALLGWIGAAFGLGIGAAMSAASGSPSGLLILLLVVYCVAALVWLAGLFWRLAEQRGLSGWVGLACFIPLLGTLFFLYLALHDGLVRPSAIGLVVTALLSLGATVNFQQQLAEVERGAAQARARGVDLEKTPAGRFVAALAGSAEKRDRAPRREGEKDGGILARLRAWTSRARASAPSVPSLVDGSAIPDDVVCEPGTRIAGARPPQGDALWCERPDGRKHGWYLAWYPDGTLEEAGRYADGLRQGVWTRFWESGGQRTQVAFENGREHGVLVLWDEFGRVEREIRYAHGEPVGSD